MILITKQEAEGGFNKLTKKEAIILKKKKLIVVLKIYYKIS